MDVKEVRLRSEAITKAISSGEPSSSIIKLLADLKTGVHATEDVLRQSKVGVTVNRLRTHKDPAVAKLAAELVNKWKDEVNRQKKKAPGSSARSSVSAPVPANGAKVPSPALASATASPPPAAAAKRKHSVDPASRSHATDKVNIKVTGVDSRDNCVGLMYNGLAFMSEEPSEDILRVAKDVEAAAWICSGNSNTEAYRMKIRSLFQNLKSKTNPALRTRVLTGEIDPHRFVNMSHDEMKSDIRRAEDEKLEKQNMNEAMVAQVEKSISKEFQCGKCKKKEVSYSQAQTRSADEPMTTFCECMNCGNRWKFS